MARAPGPGIRRGVRPQFATARPLPPKHETPAVTPVVDAGAVAPNSSVLYTEKFAPKPASEVALRPTTVDDVDRLWDWIRSDRDGTTAFLGHTHQNSRAFFEQIGQIAVKERDGVAWMRSISRGDELIGFVVLDPITRGTHPVGTCHIYINPETRGQLPALLPSILADGDRQLPNMTYFVATQDDALSSLLQSAGFSAQIVLTRAASLGEPHGSEGR